MGYYVEMTGGEFVIPDTAEVLQVLKDLNKRDDLKRGGSYTEGERTGWWFSWMPDDYDTTVTSVEEVFQMLGFDTLRHLEGVELMGYDNKTGQEDVFLEAVAPFVEEGSWLEWRGEDGMSWRYVATDRQLITVTPTINWNY